jgi:hypothetical protein
VIRLRDEQAFVIGNVVVLHMNAGAVEEIRGQADGALDDAALDEISADDALGVAAKENAVREDARTFLGALERAENVQEVGVVTLLGGRNAVTSEPAV